MAHSYVGTAPPWHVMHPQMCHWHSTLNRAAPSRASRASCAQTHSATIEPRSTARRASGRAAHHHHHHQVSHMSSCAPAAVHQRARCATCAQLTIRPRVPTREPRPIAHGENQWFLLQPSRYAFSHNTDKNRPTSSADSDQLEGVC